MKRLMLLMGWFGLLAGRFAVSAHGQGGEVVVVYNTRLAESKGVAEHYAEVRHVPASQVFGFDLPTTETMTRTEFREDLQQPLVKALESRNLWQWHLEFIRGTNGTPERGEWRVTHAGIRYAVLCYGVPLKIARDPELREKGEEKLPSELQRNEAAVDSELACLPLTMERYILAGPRRNPLYSATNAASFNPTNGILMVARLDGPTAAMARGLVDKALEAETNGLWGRAYFDMRGLTNGDYKLGDDSIRGAAQVSRLAGFETIVDDNPATFPASFPLSQVALYAGWYDASASGPFAEPSVEFMPGAFAYHLHSFSAATVRSTTRAWVGPLVAKGVTATMGTVDEPYLSGTPDMSVFFPRLIYLGFTFGEAAYAAATSLSWQTTVVGDPLYRPFGQSPQALHEDLARRKSKLLEWSYLRVVNITLAKGTPLREASAYLEELPLTKESAVLMEKLGELYSAQGKPSSSVYALQQALKLDPSPQQRTRITLTLADRLMALDRNAEAYELYQEFLGKFPDYPDQLAVYRQILSLAQKLGKKDDATKYQREIDRLTSTHGLNPTGPPQRRGV
ncbi:MAG TPA: TIGR03790 family protein [Verrucomicrobiae bacterium]|nr:TIGR03790 family protein [Verrucomicrobiae bacterium]